MVSIPAQAEAGIGLVTLLVVEGAAFHPQSHAGVQRGVVDLDFEPVSLKLKRELGNILTLPNFPCL